MEYKIQELEDFTPQIGHLVSQMNYARQTTIEAVTGLSASQLDILPREGGNTIGSLLLHIAAIEKGFQIEFFEHRTPNSQEMKEWGTAYSLGDDGRNNISGNSLDYYFKKLKGIRERTLDEFKALSDEWLYQEVHWENQRSNNYFIWFHVLEDEINHRGQIRWIRKWIEKEGIK